MYDKGPEAALVARAASSDWDVLPQWARSHDPYQGLALLTTSKAHSGVSSSHMHDRVAVPKPSSVPRPTMAPQVRQPFNVFPAPSGTPFRSELPAQSIWKHQRDDCRPEASSKKPRVKPPPPPKAPPPTKLKVTDDDIDPDSVPGRIGLVASAAERFMRYSDGFFDTAFL